jgi:hypothetical protein
MCDVYNGDRISDKITVLNIVFVAQDMGPARREFAFGNVL